MSGGLPAVVWVVNPFRIACKRRSSSDDSEINSLMASVGSSGSRETDCEVFVHCQAAIGYFEALAGAV